MIERRQMRRLSALLVLLAGLAVMRAAPADAGGYLVANAAKQESGPYKNLVLASLGQHQSKSFFVKAKNRSEQQIGVAMFQETLDLEGYTQKYFRGRNNITPEVTGSGFDFNLDAGQAKVFRVKIKRGGPSSDPDFCSVVLYEEIGGGGDDDSAFIGLNGDQCAG